MNDPSDVSSSTADRLRQIAAHRLLAGGADQLRALADDLADNKLQRWTDVDLFAAFAVTTEGDVPLPEESSSLLRWLEAAKSVLVFFPLVVTWSGVASAATGYARLVDKHPEAATTSFLALWENGFDGHAPMGLTLWRVAMLDVLFIVALIAATLIAGRVRSRWERRLHGESRALRAELAAALVDVGLRLSEVRLASPARFQAELSRSAELMATWHEKAVAATEPTAAAAVELSAAGRELTVAIDTVTAANATVGEQVAALTARVGELVESEAHLRDRLDKLFADQSAVLQESSRTREMLGRVISTTGELVQALERESQQTSTTATSALEESRNLVALAEGARDAQATLTAAVEQLVARVGEATTAIDGVGSNLSTAGSTFETTVSSTSEALGRASTALEDAAASERAVAEHLQKASSSMEAGVGALREDLTALPALVDEVFASLRQLADEVARLRNDEKRNGETSAA